MERACKHKGRAVYQCDEDGNRVKRWGKISDAARSLGVCPSSISIACRKGRRCKGYKWVYADKVEFYSGEIWMPVGDTQYRASSRGRIRYPSGKITEGSDIHGHYYARFGERVIYAERLVALAFIGESTRDIIHIDGNNKNNRPENLRYA